MSITIESPTAEAAWRAVQQLPPAEIARLKTMLEAANRGENDQDFWTNEDLQDSVRPTVRLVEKRFGVEGVGVESHAMSTARTSQV